MPTTQIDFPKGRHVEVRDRKNLLLLSVHGRNIADRAVVGIPLDPSTDNLGEVAQVIADNAVDRYSRRNRRRRISGGVEWRSLPGRYPYPLTERQMSTALVPPNAKEFDMTVANSTPLRAAPGT
jgi:hypothetical protein